jgi:hypothetical protein
MNLEQVVRRAKVSTAYRAQRADREIEIDPELVVRDPTGAELKI